MKIIIEFHPGSQFQYRTFAKMLGTFLEVWKDLAESKHKKNKITITQQPN
jgi:hypothetical protein